MSANSEESQRHDLVERARQALVKAEQRYLIAWGWEHVQLGGEWLWVRRHPAGGAGVMMQRADAVKFQHNKLGGMKV